MPVTTTKSSKTFQGNGGSGPFACDFRIFAATDLVVSRVDTASGSKTPLVLNTDFTVTGANSDSGFSLTTTAPIPTGQNLLVKRQVPFTQPTSFTNQSRFFPVLHQDMADRLEFQVQQLADSIGRSLTFPDGLGTDFSGELPYPTPANLIGWNSDGTALQNAGSVIGTALGFQQAGAGAVVRYAQDKMRETVSILDFGGQPNGPDNATAFAKAAAAAGANGSVRFPGKSGDYYYFATDPNLGLAVIDAAVGVKMTGNVGINSTIRVSRPVSVDVASGQNFTHDLTPEYSKEWNGKDLWLSDGDIDRSTVTPINAQTESTPLVVALSASDNFADATAQVTFSSSSQIQWGSSPADASIRCSMVTVRPGDEVNFAFFDTGTYRRAAIIRTSAGYYWVYADGGGATPHIGGKLLSQAATDATFTYEGMTDHPAYYPENGDWTIRVIDRNHFSVLINGLEVTNVQTVTGDIYQVGPGIGALGSAKTINVAGFSRWRTRPHGGKRGQTILCIGDSLTDGGVHGGWPYAMREALAGSFGIRLLGLYNQAISGDNINHQLSVLQANGTHNASVAVIALGTNDAQFSTNPAAYISDLTTMVTALRTNFCEPVIWIHQAWYEQTQSGGGGQASINSGSGAYLRALILRFCADNGVKCIDMRNVSGAITATWLLTGKGTKTNTVPVGMDPWVRDNIHPTTHGYRVMGFNIARAVAGLLNPPYTRTKVLTTLPSAGALNGWTTSIQTLQYSMTADGIVKLIGVLNGGTITGGTIMYQLPKHAAPVAVTRTPCATNVANGYAMIQIGVDGAITIFNAPVGTTYVDMSPVSYQSAG